MVTVGCNQSTTVVLCVSVCVCVSSCVSAIVINYLCVCVIVRRRRAITSGFSKMFNTQGTEFSIFHYKHLWNRLE